MRKHHFAREEAGKENKNPNGRKCDNCSRTGHTIDELFQLHPKLRNKTFKQDRKII